MFKKGHGTVCPVSSDPFYVVTYYIKWVTTYWTYSKFADSFPKLALNHGPLIIW